MSKGGSSGVATALSIPPLNSFTVKKLEIMEIPRYVVFGPKAVSEIAKVCSALGLGRRVAIVCGGEKTTKIAEEEVRPVLEKENFDIAVLPIGSGYPTVSKIVEIEKAVKSLKIEVVLAVGGGRTIDVAKLAATWAGVPYISVPTSAANDGISSPTISFLLKMDIREKLGREYTKAKAPIAIVADTKIISRAPPETVAAGCGDMLAKFVAVRDWRLAYKLRGEDFSEYAASVALMSAELIVKKADYIKRGLEESTRLLVKALIGSGVAISIAGSSRPASGSEHLFSHALDLLSRKYGFKPAPHGMQCGVGAIMMMWLHGGDWIMIRETLRKVGAPTCAEELGIEPKYVIEALTIAHKIRPERYTILGEKGLSREAAIRMARETEVI